MSTTEVISNKTRRSANYGAVLIATVALSLLAGCAESGGTTNQTLKDHMGSPNGGDDPSIYRHNNHDSGRVS